jgi:hypothetical protein
MSGPCAQGAVEERHGHHQHGEVRPTFARSGPRVDVAGNARQRPAHGSGPSSDGPPPPPKPQGVAGLAHVLRERSDDERGLQDGIAVLTVNTTWTDPVRMRPSGVGHGSVRFSPHERCRERRWDDEVFIRRPTTGSVQYAAVWCICGDSWCDTAGFQLHVELVHTDTGHQHCICRLQRGAQRRAIQQCSGLDHCAFQRTRCDLTRIRGPVFVETSRIVPEAIHVGCDGQGFRPNDDRKLGEGRHRFRGHCL